MAKFFGALFFLLALCSFVYFYFGMEMFIRAKSKISTYDKQAKVRAMNDLMGNGVGDNFFGGLVARVWTRPLSGVWIWGRKGLMFFRTDSGTVFSVFSGCNFDVLNPNSEKTFSIDRTFYKTLQSFESSVSIGDYVNVITLETGNVGSNSLASEVVVSDWWSFIMGDMSIQCAK